MSAQRRVGLVGGMSWESTVTYYQLINRGVQQRRGGLHSADLLLHSLDFAVIERQQAEGRWQDAATTLSESACGLVKSGAQAIAICTNTMHKVADEVSAAIDVPLLHIGDATGQAIKSSGMTRVGLLGTRFTMEQDFLVDRLRAHGLDVLIPPEEDRLLLHRVIYDELCRGQIEESSRLAVLEIIRGLQRRDAEGIIFGCTEIGLLIGENDSPLRVFDTTKIHAEAIVNFALAG